MITAKTANVLPHMTAAEQCRALGLNVGDTIEGTEHAAGWWSTARLTLIWCGEAVAVWSVRTMNNAQPEWSQPREMTNWNLAYRDWRKVEP